MESKKIIYSAILALSLMTFCPLTGVGADSLWDYESMDSRASEMSENLVVEDFQPVQTDAIAQAEEVKKKRFLDRFKKDKKEKKVTPEKELPAPPAEILYDAPNEKNIEQEVTTETIIEEVKKQDSRNEIPAVSRATKESEKYIKDIEVHGNNVVETSVILDALTQKKG